MSIDNLVDFFSRIPSLQFTFWDFLDIAFVTFLIYYAIRFVRETRTFQLLKGLAFFGILYFLVTQANMATSTYIFQKLFGNIFIIIIILFQHEIRQALEHFGVSYGSALRSGSGDAAMSEAINEIVKAVDRMSESKTGALLVMERQVLLSDIAESGTRVDAEISHELIGNIFFVNSPLHDGAAVVREARLYAAGCVLPLTKSNEVSSDLGTRHRAALGLSEVSDALIIVVSEETGTISLASNGSFERGLNESELRERLMDAFNLTAGQKKSSGLKSKIKGALSK